MNKNDFRSALYNHSYKNIYIAARYKFWYYSSFDTIFLWHTTFKNFKLEGYNAKYIYL